MPVCVVCVPIRHGMTYEYFWLRQRVSIVIFVASCTRVGPVVQNDYFNKPGHSLHVLDMMPFLLEHFSKPVIVSFGRWKETDTSRILTRHCFALNFPICGHICEYAYHMLTDEKHRLH